MSGAPGYTRYKVGGDGDADTVLTMTTVGLTSEAMLDSGSVVNPHEDDLRRFDEILENQVNLHGEEKRCEMFRIRLLAQEFVTTNRPASLFLKPNRPECQDLRRPCGVADLLSKEG
jgi:hypothetical protein